MKLCAGFDALVMMVKICCRNEEYADVRWSGSADPEMTVLLVITDRMTLTLLSIALLMLILLPALGSDVDTLPDLETDANKLNC